MHLGAFSISLGVKDLAKSRAFYEGLGFEAMHDQTEAGFVILRQGETLIGLFQGMFEGPMLTFNPGWDQSAAPVDPFDDVRDIREKLRAAGYDIQQEQGGDEGPASFVVVDPDGLPVLIDQHR